MFHWLRFFHSSFCVCHILMLTNLSMFVSNNNEKTKSTNVHFAWLCLNLRIEMTGWLFFSIWIIFLTFFLSISHPMSVVFAAKWIHNTLISMNEKNQFPCLKYSIEFPFENSSFPLISLNRIHTYSLFNRLSLSSLNKPVAESLSIKFQLVYGFRTMEWRNEWVWWMKWSSFNRKLCNNEHTKKKEPNSNFLNK